MGRIPQKVQRHRVNAFINDLGIKLKRLLNHHAHLTPMEGAEVSKVKLEIKYREEHRHIYNEIRELTGTLIRPKFGLIMIIGSVTDIQLSAYLVEYLEAYISLYGKAVLNHYRKDNKSKRALMRKFPNWQMGDITDARVIASFRKKHLRGRIQVVLKEVEQHNPMRILFQRKVAMIKFKLYQKYSIKWRRKI